MACCHHEGKYSIFYGKRPIYQHLCSWLRRRPILKTCTSYYKRSLHQSFPGNAASIVVASNTASAPTGNGNNLPNISQQSTTTGGPLGGTPNPGLYAPPLHSGGESDDSLLTIIDRLMNPPDYIYSNCGHKPTAKPFLMAFLHLPSSKMLAQGLVGSTAKFRSTFLLLVHIITQQ
ncbi:hypothetical protein BU25DRAFT_424183 [Macroventuria anomochaeta]|uniref:Uncharacterized protein n=1 Tax=Macroventuria anomochaeta TaxID=301207 RepID=A0ACB6RRS4_9PLEO|nr:uncharacterized protein BU25DRAFT_424183 [Macroventuria anomochaeta]KAF2624407.1 hypothetical protein BU25DRAFT_424183 [Macroventuria anomochaeta]